MKDKCILYSVTDNHYCPLLASLIVSIGANTSPDTIITYYIVDDDISDRNKSKILSSNTFSNIKLIWVPFKDAIPNMLSLPRDNSSWPRNLYGRLFPELFVREEPEKVCYLDVDLIVNEDITNLVNMQFEEHEIVASVQDSRIERFSNRWGGIKNHIEMGFNGDEPYFNTGLLVLNYKKWVQENIGVKVLKTIQQNLKNAVFPDQYGLNIVLHGAWKQLPERYNFFADKDCETLPAIFHYIGVKPLYRPNDSSKIALDTFTKYYRSTLFYKAKQKSIINLYLRKIRNRIAKKFSSYYS